MKKFMTSILVAYLINAVPGHAETVSHQADVSALQSEIASIETRISALGDGLLKNLLIARKEILTLSVDAFNYLEISKSEKIEIDYTVALPKPDNVKAANLLSEIQRQQEVIKKAEQEADKAGGLLQALALSRVETEKITLSQLKLGYFQALYGLPIPSIKEPSSTAKTGDSSDDVTTSADENNETKVEWADAKYPQINYDHSNFENYSKAGFYFNGMWALKEDKSEIDDSLEITATNLGDWYRSSYAKKVMLFARCAENKAALIYSVDAYLMNTNYDSSSLRVTYRIDEQPAVNTRWSETTSNQAVGLFGNKAEEFFPKLYNAKKLFIRVKESNGQSHDATFDLTGMPETLDKIGATCGFSVLDLSRDDYKTIQTLLNAGGFNAGTPDGIWGRGSKAALKKFQETKGLDATGAIDKATLSALGL